MGPKTRFSKGEENRAMTGLTLGRSYLIKARQRQMNPVLSERNRLPDNQRGVLTGPFRKVVCLVLFSLLLTAFLSSCVGVRDR